MRRKIYGYIFFVLILTAVMMFTACFSNNGSEYSDLITGRLLFEANRQIEY